MPAHAIGADQHHRADRYRRRRGGPRRDPPPEPRRSGLLGRRLLDRLDRRLGRIEPEVELVELGQRPVRPRPARARLAFASIIGLVVGHYAYAVQKLFQRRAELRWAWGDGNSSRFHRRDLALGVALAARDDRAGMAHAAARRRRAAGDEADDRLLAPALRLVGEELRGVFLGAAADLADHDDRLGLVVGEEHLEHVDELGALDRIAADADRGRLAEALVGGLEHRFIGQRAGAADDADAALLEDVAGHDPDLALARRQHARAVGADQPRLRARQRALDPDHVEHRNALGDGRRSAAPRRRSPRGSSPRRTAAGHR